MDIGLELLDFLNFDLKDEKAFKKLVTERELIKGVLYPYDAYRCLMNLAHAPFNRTSQLVKEWLVMKRGKCDFKEKNGVHVYTASVPEKQYGVLRVEVEKSKDKVYCHVVRSAEWRQNEFEDAKLIGGKRTEPLETLISHFNSWAEMCLHSDEVRAEIGHYFSHLAKSPAPPHSFAGFMPRKDRSVLVNIGLSTIADTLEVAVDMVNYKASK